MRWWFDTTSGGNGRVDVVLWLEAEMRGLMRAIPGRHVPANGWWHQPPRTNGYKGCGGNEGRCVKPTSSVNAVNDKKSGSADSNRGPLVPQTSTLTT